MKNLWRILKGLTLIVVVLSLLIAVLFGYRDIPTDKLKIKYAQKPSSFTSINAQGVSPHFSSGFAITAQATTPSILKIQFSISIEEIFSPPEIIMSWG